MDLVMKILKAIFGHNRKKVTSPAGKRLIKKFESLRLKAYTCVSGTWTIGWGTTKGVKPGMTITAPEAERMFSNDLKHFEKNLRQLVRVPLTQCQFDALVSFMYNVGVEAFKVSTLRRLLNKGQYDQVPAQLNRWVYVDGKVSRGLKIRRKVEGRVFQGYKHKGINA
jgi:lysozyme